MNKRILIAGNPSGVISAVLGARQDVELVAADADALICTDDFSNVARFYDDQKPIAAFGVRAINGLVSVLRGRGLTVATASPRVGDGVFFELCAAEDFVSDREHRVLTTPGLDPIAIARAVEELMRLA